MTFWTLPIHFTSVTQTQQSANTIAMHLPRSNKNLAFFYLITSMNIPYRTCLAPWGSQGLTRHEIFKPGDSWSDLSRQISQVIPFRYSLSVLHGFWGLNMPQCEMSRGRQSLQITGLRRNEAKGAQRAKAPQYTERETSSHGAATIEHILICGCILSLWLQIKMLNIDSSPRSRSLPGWRPFCVPEWGSYGIISFWSSGSSFDAGSCFLFTECAFLFLSPSSSARNNSYFSMWELKEILRGLAWCSAQYAKKSWSFVDKTGRNKWEKVWADRQMSSQTGRALTLA